MVSSRSRHDVEYGANKGRTIHAKAKAPVIETLSAETATVLPIDTIQDFATGEVLIDLTAIDANTGLHHQDSGRNRPIH